MPKRNTGLIVSAMVGGVALVGVLVAIVLSGRGNATPEQPAPVAKSKPEVPVNVRELTEQGMRKCEEGYAIIQSCKAKIDRPDLSPDEKRALKETLQKGVGLIDTGMRHLEQAREKGGDGGDPKKEWGQARKSANSFIANLGR